MSHCAKTLAHVASSSSYYSLLWSYWLCIGLTGSSLFYLKLHARQQLSHIEGISVRIVQGHDKFSQFNCKNSRQCARQMILVSTSRLTKNHISREIFLIAKSIASEPRIWFFSSIVAVEIFQILFLEVINMCRQLIHTEVISAVNK